MTAYPKWTFIEFMTMGLCMMTGGCDTSSAEIEQAITEPTFNVVWLDHFRKGDAVTDSGFSQEFELGSTGWGRDYVFSISAEGAPFIRGVSVQMILETSGLSLTPEFIPEIARLDIQAPSLFKVSLDHGRDANGNRTRGRFAAGSHQFALVISGRTDENIIVTDTVSLEFTALVTELIFEDDRGAFELPSRLFNFRQATGQIPGARISFYDSYGSIRIRNSGNAPVEMAEIFEGADQRRDKYLLPGDTLTVQNIRPTVIEIALEHAASDPAVLVPSTGNVAYLTFIKNE